MLYTKQQNWLSNNVKNTKNRLLKPLPYWNEDCNKTVRDRNKARNAMHKYRTLENCIKYRHHKGTAQHVIKSTAREYWQNYYNTLDKTTAHWTLFVTSNCRTSVARRTNWSGARKRSTRAMCVRARRCQCSSTESARSSPQRLYKHTRPVCAQRVQV